MKLYIPLCLFCLCFCSEPDDETSLLQEANFRVNYYKVSCTGEAVQECLLIQEGETIGTNDWTYFYDQIEGFNYESGFVYDLIVSKSTIENPPQDGSSIAYSLVEVLSKTKH